MKLLSISDFHGALELLEGLKKRCKELSPDTIVFTGDVVKGYARGDEWLEAKRTGREPNRNLLAIIEEAKDDLNFYHLFYRALESLDVPVFAIPGNMDAPEERFFSVVLNYALSSKNIKIVQEHWAVYNDFLFAGFGGEITEEEKENFFVLQYPKKEVEFALRSLKYIRKDKILFFHTPPVGKIVDVEGETHRGSEVVNALIQGIQPKIAFCGHAHKAQGVELIGSTIVINPGALKNNCLCILETKEPENPQFLPVK